MIEGRAFLTEAVRRRFDFFTGVPCSFLQPFINGTIMDRRFRYVGATSEGEAVGIAAGAYLAGHRSVVMCQNSGLGNMINPLTSLTAPFRIPMLLIVTWRGQPGLNDEPQHEVMGKITHSLLDTIGMPWRPFPRENGDIVSSLDAADEWMKRENLPFALVMEKGSVADEDLRMEPFAEPGAFAAVRRVSPATDGGGGAPTRYEAIETIRKSLPADTLIVATTGKCGRELFTIEDRPEHFYVVGSMGCASAIGLGVALNAARRVVVLDGDGAALMKLGNLATIGAMRPSNLLHVVLDNGAHDSTGGQATVAPTVSFPTIAASCSYASAYDVRDLAGLGSAIRTALGSEGPTLISVHLSPGGPAKLGRPTVHPSQVAVRFRNNILDGTQTP